MLSRTSLEQSFFSSQTLSYPQALEALKLGYAAARAGWNGKNMYIYLNRGSFDFSNLPDRPPVPPGSRFDDNHQLTHLEGISIFLFDHGPIGTVTRLPNLNMRAASGSTVTGWLASQIDQLADDWQLMPGMYFGPHVAMTQPPQ